MEIIESTLYERLKWDLEDSEYYLRTENLERQYDRISKLFKKGDLDAKEYMELMDMLTQLMIKQHKLFTDALGKINIVMNQLGVASSFRPM